MPQLAIDLVFDGVCPLSASGQAMLKYDASAREVQLVVDRAYSAGEPVYAWCGPQPNRRLLLNYSIVDDNNPYGAKKEPSCSLHM